MVRMSVSGDLKAGELVRLRSRTGNPGQAGGAGRACCARALVTGGAGFIGSRLVERLLEAGCRVTVLDDLSRVGARHNAQRLRQQWSERLAITVGDVRDRALVDQLVGRADAVFHLAGRIALARTPQPRRDFEINAMGALNVLEAMRHCALPPVLVAASSWSVYGRIEDLTLETRPTRYEPADETLRTHGIAERAIAFETPFGCAKGVADQYVAVYGRTFELPATVLRAGAVYGPGQREEDNQEWPARLLPALLRGQPTTMLGDGRQVRDLLHVDDMVEAMLRAAERISRLRGRPWHVGGGPANAVSALDLLELAERLTGRGGSPTVWQPWPADAPPYAVADTRRFAAAADWSPRVNIVEGVAALHRTLGGCPAPQVSPVRPSTVGAAP